MYQRERLFNQLGAFAYKTFVEATRLCRSYRHEYVELEHWLKVLVDQQQGDVPALLAHYGLNQSVISARLDNIIQHMPNTHRAGQDLSARLEAAVELGLLMSQVIGVQRSIRTAHILLGLLQDMQHQRWLYRLCDEFKKLPIPQIAQEYESLLRNSIEHEDAQQEEPIQANSSTSKQMTEGDAVLDKWCVDLTAQAIAGEIDPVIGREAELRQVIDILSRRRQNNPILVGEAGVGKTAVVEALARKLASGDVPPLLSGARLLSLDLGRMQAGASMRGEFESRLKALIDGISRCDRQVILFCDEAHTLVGAGGQTGTGDAVNLLKPMLARGALRMIAATTWSEYKQFIEPDSALTRRFQRVLISEPNEPTAVDMLRAIAPHFAKHHGVMIRDSAILAAVRLSLRNLPSRQLPDKAISLLDTACARVALSQHAEPQIIAELSAQLGVLNTEYQYLQREHQLGAAVNERLAKVEAVIPHLQGELTTLRERTQSEQELVQALLPKDDAISAMTEHSRWPELVELQQNDPLVYPWVDEQTIAEVLSDWTGIPSGKMLQDDIECVLDLEHHLGNRIFGQENAIKEIAQAVRIARAGIQSQERPLGIFLLAGPTGTGKTETAHVLANTLYGGVHNLITFNMSEFQEAHTLSTLKGAPPGYVGYGKGGKLTEAVRRKPYSVILLDEFDKAHPDIHDAFYQVFDKGWMEDAEGRIVSFRQCFILLTCNQGADEIEQAYQADSSIKLSTLKPIVYDALLPRFAPALLARVNIIPYLPLQQNALAQISAHYLSRLQLQLADDLGITLLTEGDIPLWIAERVLSHPNRGRAVEELLRQTMLPAIGNEILRRQHDATPLKEILLMVEDANMSMEFA
ncbi:type VI secretion system ATPase TssH [Serratia sp. UGAL515B_01]|uniref:type VI secretion system ATPase TssH n=1 Tax=Serratia sp. UGAL515B_01 TaxID=2986763 RepID=UPI0029555335|nr:type VI secretion system ATPase TssH [Serratia sp. UGAL515B_01]WON77459.1 type VI secretion system ATPase TssH [Serratia sp. UGAL515B_01]